MRLLEPLDLGPANAPTRTAPNRIVFGPHVTNLGDDHRRLTRRHTAYYERRASAGCGTIVVEGASVHDSDWPYERSPLAERCGDGWADVVAACAGHGTVVLAGLTHTGGQGSSAYSQSPLWAPSRVPEVNTREVPKWMEPDDIAAVVQGFADAARLAVDAGCHGVEIDAGQHSLVRQFLSGLTNQRDDPWGHDKVRFAREVVTAVRAAVPDAVVALRFSADELAPWAGITPEMAPGIATELVAAGVDLVTVVRGSIFSVEQTRPDFHAPTGFNVELARSMHAALDVPVVLQGSMVDVGQAEWALGGYDDPAAADAVEMTRAQIADPDLVRKLTDGDVARIRPCTRCNQTCQVRDARNPIVTCVGEPTSGRETEDPDWTAPTDAPTDVVVVGGGVAGLEAARVAALRGHRVTIVEQRDRLGGVAADAGPHAALVEWLERECRAAGVTVRTGVTVRSDGSVAHAGEDVDATLSGVVVQCTGSRPGHRPYDVDADAVVVADVLDVRRGQVTVPDEGPVVLFDPVGGPIAVALAEEFGARAVLVTQDQIAGNELSRTGDLAPANTRLAQAGARIERRSLLRRVTATGVELEDRFSGARRSVEAVAVVDCGFRLPDHALDVANLQAGDCVAPRTVHEAVLEGRRAAVALDQVRARVR